ncbi:glycerate dehydrogenase [Metarhizium rileyi]|uniref:Glycerate dehydrogenase n=1 Tax=Metarhizium rileyi (strain RCEF 4871) TaxID=1649241 RepID=A0A166Y1P3_METRR|nr:glycerate dehydrogenase [Metarhizium rileyi RCEF 4871]
MLLRPSSSLSWSSSLFSSVARGQRTARGRPSLAIIDDYLNTSGPHFAHIPPSSLQVTTFNDTVIPSNETETARLADRLRPFDLISTVRERTAFPATLLRRLPNLKLLLATGTQFEEFDLAAARELGITVVAAPGRGRSDQVDTRSNSSSSSSSSAAGHNINTNINIKKGRVHPTTQHTWALIMALARNVAADDCALKAGYAWQSGLAMGLTGLTLGVVGLGRLGAAVARIGHVAWGMRVVCWSNNLTQEKADGMAVEMGLSPDGGIDGDGNGSGSKTFLVVSKEELFRGADVVSLHYVLSDRSRGLVGAKELEQMKSSALLVNTSRGPLIDSAALLDAMERGGLHGAALDVYDVEPLPLSSPWRRAGYWGTNGRSRLVMTPHMGYADQGLMNAWYAETAENVERWLEGKQVLHRIA